MKLVTAYLLHSRPYRETSLIAEFFTEEQGRISAVAKGVRTLKSKSRGLLQAFVPLLISTVGRTELLTLKSFESAGAPHILSGRQLASGFYLNELLMRLLHKHDAHAYLFQYYQKTLTALEMVGKKEKKESLYLEKISLRLFEKNLLKELGYELQLNKEVETGKPVLENEWYVFDAERGPYWVDSAARGENNRLFKGKNLLSLANLVSSENENHPVLADELFLRDAKRLLRQALTIHLGIKPLESRKLFV